MLELYHNDMSTCAQKVRFQLAQKGIDWTGHELNLRIGEQHRPEFLRLNPKGVVPVLVHDGAIIVESNIIMEYVEEVFPATPLLPAAPADRATAREWLQRLDAGLHLAIAVVSIGVAFRTQLIEAQRTEAALQAYYDAVPDPALRAIYRELVPAGVDGPSFTVALTAWMKTLHDMEKRLATRPFLLGEALTLADIGMVPYLCRLDHLSLDRAWATYPNVAAWYGRMQATEGFRVGIEKWLNPKYLKLMSGQGDALRPRTDVIVDKVAAGLAAG